MGKEEEREEPEATLDPPGAFGSLETGSGLAPGPSQAGAVTAAFLFLTPLCYLWSSEKVH